METNNNPEFNPQEVVNPGTAWVIDGYKSEIERLTRMATERQEESTNMFRAFMDLCGAVEDLFRRMMEDDIVDSSDHPYMEYFRKWIDSGKIDIDLTEERRYRVEVNITVAYDVSIQCPKNASDTEVERRLNDAFERADGDENNVDDDIDDDYTINSISVWDRDVHVDSRLD